MIIANFDKGSTREDVFRIYQYDYGQVLRIQGLNLPPAVEVDFSLQNTGGETTTRIGVTKDGVTDVVIPDSLLENGDIAQDYEIYAFVYLRNETSGQTEYKITLHITSRPKPEAFDRPEDAEIFKEAIKAVNESAARSAESEKQAEGWAHGREDLPERAQDNAKYYSDQAREDSAKTDADRKEVERLVESVSGIGEQVEKVEGLTKQAQISATNAALSEQAAKESENNAAQARAGAEVAEDNAELAAQKAEQDKFIVEQAKNLVKQMGQEVLDNKKLVDETAQGFDLKAQQALADVNNAGQEQTERVQTAGNDAVESVKTAQSTATREVETAKTGVEQATLNANKAITNANNAKGDLEKVITNAGKVKADLSEVITQANVAKTNLDNSVKTANQVLQSLDSENTAAASNIEELRSENFNSQEILAGVADIRAYLGITADDIVGIQVDYKNKTFKRLAGAANLTKGSDFDKFTMFGGRKRCNVADDGSIVAWYGDADYKEDGSMGQVMVYQPKFYYLVCPVEYDPIDTGIGYHLRKANYYVSEKPRAGFRLHPAFYDANGNEIDYFLTSAYEGSIWDADGDAYLLQDEQVMNAGGDKFSSISGARPASGSTQGLTRTAIEQMAQNRGANWHGDLIKQVSAEQMLMIIEMGMMNLQTAIAQGVVTLPLETGSDKTSSYAAVTGSTSGIGNGTGRAERTTTYEGGVAKEYTVDGKTSVCWRGKENFWGNIWKFVYGINIWGNGKMGGGQPYICSDFNFAENKNSGNYEPAGFTVTNANGYISAMGYSTACDWLFIASECLGNSSLPVGDYTYITVNLNGYCIALLGGAWNSGGSEGGFYWNLGNGVGNRYRIFGGRLVYVPTRDSATYTAAIEAWKQKMAA